MRILFLFHVDANIQKVCKRLTTAGQLSLAGPVAYALTGNMWQAAISLVCANVRGQFRKWCFRMLLFCEHCCFVVILKRYKKRIIIAPQWIDCLISGKQMEFLLSKF